MEPYIETYTGKKFWFLQPDDDDFCIEDIAHALSNICRFTGHIKEFMSVAEHSVNVSYLVPKEYALEGLLHDASEAYLIDIASPIKQFLPDYKELESTIMAAAADAFGFAWPLHPEIKEADKVQLKTEARHLLPTGGRDWIGDFVTTRRGGVIPDCWSPKQAEKEFLKRYYELVD